MYSPPGYGVSGLSAHDSTDVAEVAARVKDPVCGMSVDPATTPHHAMFEGEDFHFCGAGAVRSSRPIPTAI